MAIDGGPQKPGESEGAYMRRMNKYANEQAQLKKQRDRDEAIEKSLRGQAVNEQIEKAIERGDVDWDVVFKDEVGFDARELIRDIEETKFEMPLLDAALKDLNSSKTKWTKRGRARAAKKAVDKHRGTFQKAKKGVDKKKGWGCVVTGILLLGAVAGMAYGSYEGVAALVSALG